MKLQHLVLPVLLVVFLASFTLSLSHDIDVHRHHQETPAANNIRVGYGGPISSPSQINHGGHDNFDDSDLALAKGDGIKDDTKAFKEAWKRACSSRGRAMLFVPNNTYLLKPIKFSGHCKPDHLTLRIKGTILASPNRSDYHDRTHWIGFEDVDNFRVEGGGTFDGNGRIWWKNSCKINKSLPCSAAPTVSCDVPRMQKLRVANMKFRNAQKMHVSFQKCVNVIAFGLRVTAPEHSPNTDGIHITGTSNITLRNSIIATGDDCISIVSGSKNVRATRITCGPGHGISIGSLGAGNSEAHVSNVFVNEATFSGTTNGVRIKTWQGGYGYARNIWFENITMNKVKNPIIIDQNYCDKKKPCGEQKLAVQIRDVVYRNIRGTSSSEVAIRFDCSEHFPCRGISLRDVVLEAAPDNDDHHGRDDEVEASCHNVTFHTRGKVSPSCS
ncbi:hypothetical protein FNV43_RR20667 [Rhamnella rubrinervis]|uniref:endo-polygalacturonase n=1 Tax=Rhamnella rubrinervis TaxID=2594499 RepID=A0A8K0E054_9ROSA|nr:hypothetical protein FNV43_RR20667 [Rhamnella rubrinervis]